MANDYYVAPSKKVPLTTIRSTVRNNDAAAVEAGFEKLPDELDIKRDQFGADTSTVSTLYVLTIPNLTVAYYTGLAITFEATVANTGAASVQVNGGVIVDLVDAANNALVVGAIVVGQMVQIVYSSTSKFQVLITDSASASAAASAASATESGEARDEAVALVATIDEVAQHFLRGC